jgi:hypothetical protein
MDTVAARAMRAVAGHCTVQDTLSSEPSVTIELN